MAATKLTLSADVQIVRRAKQWAKQQKRNARDFPAHDPSVMSPDEFLSILSAR